MEFEMRTGCLFDVLFFYTEKRMEMGISLL